MKKVTGRPLGSTPSAPNLSPKHRSSESDVHLKSLNPVSVRLLTLKLEKKKYREHSNMVGLSNRQREVELLYFEPMSSNSLWVTLSTQALVSIYFLPHCMSYLATLN